jgi:hypothetical protein
MSPDGVVIVRSTSNVVAKVSQALLSRFLFGATLVCELRGRRTLATYWSSVAWFRSPYDKNATRMIPTSEPPH